MLYDFKIKEITMKTKAHGISCRSNVRTLALAWLMYKDESEDKLVGG